MASDKPRCQLLRRLHKVDLRFANPQDEAAFVKHRSARGLLSTLAILLFAVVVYLGIQGAIMIRQKIKFQGWDAAHLEWSLMVVLCVVLFARLKWNLFSILNQEYLSFVAMVLVMSGLFRVRHGCESMLYGSALVPADFAAVALFDELQILFHWAALVAAVGSFGPLRFHLIVAFVSTSLLAYFAVVLYSGCPYQGSQFPRTMSAMIMFSLLTLLSAWWHEAGERKEWRQSEALVVSTSMAGGMRAIADRLCDLVFTLNRDLEVCANEVVHKSFFNRTIVGEPFCNLVAEKDQSRFLQMLEQSTTLQIPQCIHLTLLCEDSTFEAELLAVDTGKDQEHYIIGVRLDAPLTRGRASRVLEPVLESTLSCLVELGGQFDTSIEPEEERLASHEGNQGASHVAESLRSAGMFRCLNMDDMEELAREEHWWIEPSDLRLTRPVRVLGEGGFGQVVVGAWNGRAVAIKTAHSKDNNHNNVSPHRRTAAGGHSGNTPNSEATNSLSALANELRVLRRVRHPNLVQFYGAVFGREEDELTLVFELLCGPRLDECLAQGPEMPQILRHRIILDVCSALWYLHRQEPTIVHADVKAGNVMVEHWQSSARAKLIDFGLSSVVTRREQNRGGTLGWSAPENILKPKARPKASSDVFSFGWLIWFVLTGLKPYGGLSGLELAQAVKLCIDRGHIELPRVAANLPVLPPHFVSLITACLNFQPSLRPDLGEVYYCLTRSPQESCLHLGFEATVPLLPSVPWSATHHRDLQATSESSPRSYAPPPAVSDGSDLNWASELSIERSFSGGPSSVVAATSGGAQPSASHHSSDMPAGLCGNGGSGGGGGNNNNNNRAQPVTTIALQAQVDVLPDMSISFAEAASLAAMGLPSVQAGESFLVLLAEPDAFLLAFGALQRDVGSGVMLTPAVVRLQDVALQRAYAGGSIPLTQAVDGSLQILLLDAKGRFSARVSAPPAPAIPPLETSSVFGAAAAAAAAAAESPTIGGGHVGAATGAGAPPHASPSGGQGLAGMGLGYQLQLQHRRQNEYCQQFGLLKMSNPGVRSTGPVMQL